MSDSKIIANGIRRVAEGLFIIADGLSPLDAKPEAVKTEAVKTEAVKTEAVKTEAVKTEAVKTEINKPEAVDLSDCQNLTINLIKAGKKTEVVNELNALGYSKLSDLPTDRLPEIYHRLQLLEEGNNGA